MLLFQLAASVAVAAATTTSAPAPEPTPAPAPPVLGIVGEQQTFHDSALAPCPSGPVHIDSPPRAFTDSDGVVHLIVAGPNGPTYQWTGSPDDFASHPTTAQLDCDMVMDGYVGDNDPAAFDQKMFAQALYYRAPYVYAYGHQDYFGTRTAEPGCHRSGVVDGLPYCWYSAVSVWKARVSTSSTELAFHRARATPQHVAIFPNIAYPGHDQTPKAGWIGYGSPSNMIAGRDAQGRPDGTYYLFAYTSTGGGGQPKGVCLFRSTDPTRVNSWRAWTGTGFTQHLRDPYRFSNQPCTVVNPSVFRSAVRTVVYHPESRHYIAFVTDSQGVKYATSRDLLTWNEPQLLSADQISGYPSVFDWDGGTGPGANFDLFTDGGRGYLYFRTSVAWGHTQINRLGLDVTNY
ncbi:hypothetical protein [Jiangella alkaliphila]|uniref:Glycosyl hydrolases family 43 n=1 Tax=Jiangella alkaliphila TaxID=419479 RepID=A0A1H2LA06_9ACTN|nr:hypothetical protein [Jiangella alkaliphila]SDU77749.1 hypothetical protein SAMN04488563_5620 [Jiangella alkaliphila]